MTATSISRMANLRRFLGLVLLAAWAFIFTAPALAADPSSYLAQMPSAETVIAKTAGSDSFDTAARQFAAFDRLFSLMVVLIGDRYTAGQMTPAEKTLRDTYLGKRDLTMQGLKASLPSDQQAYEPNTRFAAWYALVDKYRADPQFNAGFLALFPASFRATYAPMLAALATEGKVPYLPPPGGGAASSSGGGSGSSALGGLGPLGLPVLILVAVMFPILLKRGRLRLDSNDVFRMYLGGSTYKLYHETGPVEGATKMGTTSVFGGGGGGYTAPIIDGYGGGGYTAPVRISSKTTIHDQFFIRQADGHQVTIKLADWDFGVADKQVVSAVWAIREGAKEGDYLVMRNHTTRDMKWGSNFLGNHLLRLGANKIALLEIVFAIGLGVLAAPIIGGLPPGLAASIGGVFVGSMIWHFTIKPRFLARFQHDGLSRITQTLDGLAAALAS
jgi:hypothetical protein